MSKKFFINNLDTDFGQALFQELVKQPTEDPIHMCTVRVPLDAKPNGIKKILKRQKPKLFTKKLIEQCQAYVYNIDQTQISDIQFGIQAMNKPFQDNKVFILVSDILAWYDSGKKIKKQESKPPAEGEEAEPVQNKQEQENKEQNQSQKEQQQGKQQPSQKQQEKPIQYTYFQDADYESRKPLEKHSYIKQIEDKVLAMKKQNIKVFVICPGIIYGCGEDALYPLFKAAWLQQPNQLLFLSPGDTLMPMIHMKDLVKFVIKVAQNPPEGPPYLLAIDQNPNKHHKDAIQSISKGIGSGKIRHTLKQTQLFQNLDRFCIHLDMKPSKHLVGTTEQPVEFQWTAREGIGKNILKVRDQFCKKHSLRPMNIMILQNQSEWKEQSQLDYILKIFSKYYRIPVLQIKQIVREAAEFAHEELRNDIEEELKNINEYLIQKKPRKLDETTKVLYRLLKWRLSQNDCMNRGFILLNFPHFSEELQYIFKKISDKKLKRKKPKQQKKPKAPIQGEQGQQQPAEEEKQQQEPEQEAQEQGEGPKFQSFLPESVISIRRTGSEGVEEVIEFFTALGIQELIYDTTGAQEHQIFQSLRNYIQRNGRPNNYLEPEENLLNKHKQFTSQQNQKIVAQRQAEKQQRRIAEQKIADARNKIRDQISEIVRTEGQEQIKKMPFRNYLMEFVVPTLNEGLLEVSNIIPNDPVDLLSEYLYQKSYDF